MVHVDFVAITDGVEPISFRHLDLSTNVALGGSIPSQISTLTGLRYAHYYFPTSDRENSSVPLLLDTLLMCTPLI
jgi:hypothetical protein